MKFILKIIILTSLALTIFIIVYLPLEKIPKNKPWYYIGLGLIIFGILCLIYSKFIGWRIECYFANDELKCGFMNTAVSFIMALFFSLMGIVWLIKDKILITFKKLK